MRSLALALALALLTVTATVLGCKTAGQQPPAPPPATADPGDIITLLNQRRADAGCPGVEPDARLSTAAQRHAIDMRDRGIRDHTGSDGSSPQARIEAAGFRPASTGEIIFWGTGSAGPPEAVKGWMDSPPHRKIIEECGFTHAGAAALRAEGQYFAVTTFGRPA
ncbi:MAG TPA: CAP domain-containing protein [Candidatus Limnocylindrales bacterium]